MCLILLWSRKSITEPNVPQSTMHSFEKVHFSGPVLVLATGRKPRRTSQILWPDWLGELTSHPLSLPSMHLDREHLVSLCLCLNLFLYMNSFQTEDLNCSFINRSSRELCYTEDRLMWHTQSMNIKFKIILDQNRYRKLKPKRSTDLTTATTTKVLECITLNNNKLRSMLREHILPTTNTNIDFYSLVDVFRCLRHTSILYPDIWFFLLWLVAMLVIVFTLSRL